MENQSDQNAISGGQKSFYRTPGSIRVFKTAIFLILAVGVFFSLYKVIKAPYLEGSASQFYPRKWVNLDENGNATPVPDLRGGTDKPLFRVAVAPIFSPEKSLEMYQGFIDYVAGRLGRKPISLYRSTASEANDLVCYGRCDIAIVYAYAFIRGEREFGMQALAVPQIAGKTIFRAVILVPKSSSAKSLLNLRGKRFGSSDIPTTSWLFPATILKHYGEDPNHFFGEHILTGSHDKSIQALLEGFIDVAAVPGIVYDLIASEDPSILKKTRILISSPPFGIPPIAVNPHMDKKLREETLSVLLNMQSDAQGKLILQKLGIERFVIPRKNLFDDLRQAVAKLEGWR
jgi:phosphonate transport system substrate-binding protein